MYETRNSSFKVSNFQLLIYQLSSTYVLVFSLRSFSFLQTYKVSVLQTQTAAYLIQADT